MFNYILELKQKQELYYLAIFSQKKHIYFTQFTLTIDHLKLHEKYIISLNLILPFNKKKSVIRWGGWNQNFRDDPCIGPWTPNITIGKNTILSNKPWVNLPICRLFLSMVVLLPHNNLFRRAVRVEFFHYLLLGHPKRI